jgi:integral membrane protein
MIHGVLFVSYTVLLVQVATSYKWPLKKTLLAFIAAFIPFGTFYANKKLYPATAN